MITLAQLRLNCQSFLDEYGAPRLFSVPELNVWINDAQRDIARRTEDILHYDTTIAGIIGTGNYALPASIIRLHRVEYQPTGDVRVYNLEIVERNEVDRVIGFNPTIQASYPWICWLWGTQGNATYPLTMSVYPTPSQGGTFNLWYFRMPLVLVNDSDISDLPNGWEDLIPLFVMAMAKMKAKDPAWKEAKQEYETRLITMIDQTRHTHDQPSQMLGNPARWDQSWLYGFDGGSW